MSKTKHPGLFIRNHPSAPQLSPELAKEIGLNESILLLQWEYWMRSEAEERDGHLWLRKTEREIQRFFPFWSTGSIHRIVQSLVLKGYMVPGSFDAGPGRGAQWFRFDWEKIGTLKSIRVDCSNLEQRLLHSETKPLQIGATVLIDDLKNKKESIHTLSIEEVKDPDALPGLRNQLAVYDLVVYDDVYADWYAKYEPRGGIGRSKGSRCTEAQYATSIENHFRKWQRNAESNNGRGHKKDDEQWDYHRSLVAPEKPVGYFEKINAQYQRKQ